ncbi:S8 family peptidase [Roseateles depolymerans]|uniref:Peptidase S8 and S53 subtilisin kexin sedolisin n=1 Tax=Roseateles depolymerans TaxID=76731 RepID=A0A0U3MJR8_9BURK|nr:S8 family peptidase [Roseateles depolymerans]ALV08973.1 Peptidase S8 and S53 subtilisin kexin sedolisin [Roseateles depolymerans]REG10056.1 peptidase MprA [Roseateles depolymerans]
MSVRRLDAGRVHSVPSTGRNKALTGADAGRAAVTGLLKAASTALLLGAAVLGPTGASAAATVPSTPAAGSVSRPMGVVTTARAQAAPDQRGDYARVIVRFKSDAASVRARPLQARATADEARDISQVRATALGLRQGHRLTARRSLDGRTHVFTATGLSSAALARQLAADPEVDAVEPDRWWRPYAVPNDPLYATASDAGVTAGQWYLKTPDSTLLSPVNAPAAWDVSTGAGVVVAVIDTGVRYDHPDLSGQLLPGYDVIGFASASSTSTATANDGDGADSDASDPGDWVDQADINSGRLGSSCTSDDIGPSSWHGTRVSGLIAASTNNGLGMAGLAYGAKVLPVRALGKCGGWQSDIEAGMRWAAGILVPGLPTNRNPARVINLSLGSDGNCSASYQSAVNAVVSQGAVVVAAAGNGNDSGGIAVGSPANCRNVVAVAAVRHSGTKVGFSNLGPEVSVSAPGGNCVTDTGCLYPILSTSNSGRTTPVAADNAYNYAGTGTSFATPLVSATAALMLAADSSLTPAQVKGFLMSSTRPFPTTGAQAANAQQCQDPASVGTSAQLECYCTTSTCGSGMVDAYQAVRSVLASRSGGTPAPAPAPTTDTSSGGGGGGGAMSAGWLLALLVACALLARRQEAVRRL